MARRRSTRKRQRIHPATLARWLTVTVITLQLALLLMFWWFPQDPPRYGSLWQALWARANMPPFYPLVGLIAVGPAATYLALTVRGPHRRLLLIAWAAFAIIALVFYAHRITIMLNILWKYG